MDDKLIEDLDVDFIKDILVSSDELQMADNFIEDFMGELNKNLDDINNQQNIQSVWISNKQDNHQQNFDNQNYIHHQNNQNQNYNNIIHNQTNNFTNDTMQPILLSPTITNENFNLHQSYQHIESQPISCLNTMNQVNTDVSSTKKVRKNLKELLNNDTNSLNGTPALIFNQDSNQFYNFNNSKIETGYTKQKARSISSIINSNNNNNNNNTNTIDSINLEAKNSQFNQNKANENVYQVDIPNIQIVIGNTQQLIPLQTNQTVEQISENKRKYNKKKISNLTTNENEPVNSIENSTKPFKLLDLVDITPRKPKFRKKTDHNAIEKKYRSSINDKIIELKTRVAGPDAKLQKSGILKKALEYITNIEDVNKRLCDENRVLRSALNTISLNLNNPEKINQALRNVNYLPFIPADSLGPNTPPTSFDGDSLYSSHESDFSLSTPSSVSSSQSQSPPSSPVKHESTKTQKRTYKKAFKKEAMLDTSRIMLCMVVMSVLFFNPFNLIINSNVNDNQQNKIGGYQNNKGINSRVLNSVEDVQFFNNSINSNQMNTNNQIDVFISWFLNLILILICLIVIYIKGEPYMELNSNDDALWLNYQMARKKFERKNYEETMDFCEKGFKELGQQLPKTHFQLIVGIMWQLVRLTLDKIYIGRIFSKIGIWLYDLKSLKMYKLSALFYYEMHKFSYLNLKSENEFTLKSLTYTTTYSYLTAFYHLISAYNMSEMYSSKKGEMNLRDEYNLCEIYFSIVLYLKFYFPSKLSKFLINHLVTKNLACKLSPSSLRNQEEEQQTLKNKQFCKLNKLKSLLKNCLFIQFTIDFENYLKIGNKSEFDSLYRQKTLNLISYKNKIFNSSFLYDSDDSVNNFETIKNDEKITAGNGVACDFILTKFQDFILFKMTNHIINRTGMVTTENIVNSSNNNNSSNSNGDSIDLMTRSNEDNYMNEEQKEVAHIDQIKFDRLKLLYENNLQYFSSSKFKKTTISDETVKQTQEILLVFLNMLNNWKLRKFDLKINTEHLVNVKKSDFIESILSVLKAYEHVFKNPHYALQHCNIAIKSLKVFNQNPDFNVNNHLIEKFELLINDWVLSAQSHVWAKHRLTQLDLFNQSLRNFQTLISNYPQLSLKAKMYETILLYTSNRNPVKLLSPTCKQTLFSKSNQDAYFSMNLILKQFQLQLLD